MSITAEGAQKPMFDKLKEAVGKFVSSIGKKELNEKRLDESLQDLQVMLVGNDVSLKVAEAICEDVKKKLLGGKVSLLENVRKIVENSGQIRLLYTSMVFPINFGQGIHCRKEEITYLMIILMV